MEDWKAVTWLPGTILVALHAASVDGKQYQLMFMPYGLGLSTFQHQNPASAQCKAMGSYWGEGHSLIRRTAEKMSYANEHWEPLHCSRIEQRAGLDARTVGTHTGSHLPNALWRQCQPTSDLNQDLGTGPAPSPGAEQSDAVRVLDKNLLQSERWHSACVLPASVAPRFPFSPGFAQTVGTILLGKLLAWGMSEDMLTALLIQGGKRTKSSRSTNRPHSERNEVVEMKPKAGSKLLRGAAPCRDPASQHVLEPSLAMSQCPGDTTCNAPVAEKAQCKEGAGACQKAKFHRGKNPRPTCTSGCYDTQYAPGDLQNREKAFYASNSLMHARTVLGGAVGDMIPCASSGSSIVCGYRDTTVNCTTETINDVSICKFNTWSLIPERMSDSLGVLLKKDARASHSFANLPTCLWTVPSRQKKEKQRPSPDQKPSYCLSAK
ncbi:hypothetical protein Anapl_03527 [Anas platyrhynchos]|uniref:Uncharacterized protein n=1 Tax=Anas platyrhynchos TaxID=8839 RepID=R0LXA4_ANAPL|nr:hypothetical protein Anapl_03527 [Anas platyrhynchos]